MLHQKLDYLQMIVSATGKSTTPTTAQSSKKILTPEENGRNYGE